MVLDPFNSNSIDILYPPFSSNELSYVLLVPTYLNIISFMMVMQAYLPGVSRPVNTPEIIIKNDDDA